MIEVELPDGTVAEFPAGTSKAEIKAALDRRFAAPATEQPGRLASAGRGALDTLAFGFDDEIGAGLKTGFGYLGDYSKAREEFDTSKQAAKQANPYSFMAGQVGGALPSMFIPGGAAARGASLAGRVGVGAASGMGMGALYGAGSADPGDRMAGAVEGGVIGGVVGGAFPLAASGISRGYRAAANALTSNRAARQVGTSPEALRMLGSAMDADGTLGRTGQQNIARAGQEGMLADAGPNAKAILDTAIQRGGAGSVAAREAIGDRVARDSGRLNQVLDATLGQPQGITASRTAIREGSKAARKSAYDAAYGSPINYASRPAMEIDEIVKTRVPKDAIDIANRMMRMEGVKSKQINAIIGDDGSLVFETLPDVRQLDYITRALRQMSESGDGAGALGGQTDIGMMYQGLARDIRGRLRDAVPNYGLALDTASDPITRSQAVKMGGKVLSRSMTRDQVAEAVQGMSRAEREAAAQGIRSNIDDMMANVTRALQDGNMEAREALKGLKELSSRANQEKVATVVGRQEAGRLFAELDRITASFELRASVAENSKTYARLATDRRVKDMTQPGPAGLLAQGQPLNAPRRLLQSITGQTPSDIARREDAVYSELANLLTRPAGQARQAIGAINGISANDVSAAAWANRIQGGLGGPHLAYPATVQAQENLPPYLRRAGRTTAAR